MSSNGDEKMIETTKNRRSLTGSFLHTVRRVSSHLDWNEELQEQTSKPEGRDWLNVIEVVLNAWCAGYYQGYCHQKYGIFPGTMTGNTWAALRELQNPGENSTRKMWFKFAAVVMWFGGNYCGLELMRHHTSKRAAFLKWFDLICITTVAFFELQYGDADEWENPVKLLMMLVSFGSGMSTVYFRMIYGVVTNRLTGNIYRLARGAQDATHGTNGCPNWKLTVGICIMFCFGLYTFYAPWAANFGLFLPVVITFSWEFLETIIETLTDGNPDTDDEMEMDEAQKELDEIAEKKLAIAGKIYELEEKLAQYQIEMNDIEGKETVIDEFDEPELASGTSV